MAGVYNVPNAFRVGDEWVREFEIDEASGEEEDIIQDTTKHPTKKGYLAKRYSTRTSEILSRCTTRIGGMTRPAGKTRWDLPNFFKDVWDQAFMQDRIYGLLALRMVTHGTIYTWEMTCPNEACNEPLKPSVDLSTLAIRSPDMAVFAEMDRQKGCLISKLPSGLEVGWRFFRGIADEDALEELARDPDHSRRYTNALVIRTMTLNGVKIGSPEEVRRMSSVDRRAWVGDIDEIEGEVDMILETMCPHCQANTVKHLNPYGDKGFFFPKTKTQRSIRSTPSSSTPASGTAAS